VTTMDVTVLRASLDWTGA